MTRIEHNNIGLIWWSAIARTYGFSSESSWENKARTSFTPQYTINQQVQSKINEAALSLFYVNSSFLRKANFAYKQSKFTWKKIIAFIHREKKASLSFQNFKSCVYNRNDLLSYNSSPSTSRIWFSYLHNFRGYFMEKKRKGKYFRKFYAPDS